MPHDLKIVLNMMEEPYFVYLNNELVMRVGGLDEDMLDPHCGPDWIELIRRYKNFSGKTDTFQLTEKSNKKYRNNRELAPKRFVDFLKGEIHPYICEEDA